jgi:hypothetical protein
LESRPVQLNATVDASCVQDCIYAYPDGEILITSELAELTDLPQSDLSNEALTVRTEGVVDQLVDAGAGSDLWHYFPALSAASIAIVVWEIWKRSSQGEISLCEFKWIATKVSGMKAGKIALLTFAMMIPVVNVVTGAALVASLLFSAAQTVKTVTR